jgi:hypothetical protein
MKISTLPASALGAVILAALGGAVALAQQDRSTLKVPDGLSFAEFKGYETWANISVSQDDKLLKSIAGNPAMIKAYQDGHPSKAKPVPDGAKMVKIEWERKPHPLAPFSSTVSVPGDLHAVEFMVKDSKRFAATGGWGYAFFDYDAASQTLKPKGTGAGCGFACHTRVADDDYVYTHYGAR